MDQFRCVPVTDALAVELLTEYFRYRAESFPTPDGYVTTFPSPQQFEPPRGAFIVLEQAGKALGCGGIRRLEATRYEVKHVWVREAGRGTGLGRQLMVELEARARAWGASELVLDTNESLAAAGGLYRSCGFDPCEPYNDNPNATTWYRKKL
ncbi:MAG: GNAT family N-acetyltransferase [Rhodoglobus sp.]